mmetsp:Transcript_36949/g.60327  ORF Transcript_36949/g.60327 Transcript_36949/m.60327 type:complete len:195 (-) Transcript_36949:65-649(-)
MASLLRAYLWYVAKGTDRENHDLALEMIISLAQSIVGEVVLVLTTILSSSFFNKHTTTLQPNDDHDSEISNNTTAFFCSRLYLALTIPVFFHIATIFALIWENSSTVCLLGTLIVLSLQYTGVAIVMEEKMGREQERPLWMCLPHAFPFIVGLVVRTLFVYTINKLLISIIQIDGAALACTGIVLFGTGSLCIS